MSDELNGWIYAAAVLVTGLPMITAGLLTHSVAVALAVAIVAIICWMAGLMSWLSVADRSADRDATLR